ncbi:unnamed protein product [Rodentolepis nana]|uniref:Uncharacterized protein n=1 Tax=Rodentolepis nana TaxID=102285 RepID=A0A0R3TUA7_RODNA|nr:unnamed protein product [Rodentolepis nana]
MFILRLAAEAVNLADEELSGHLTRNNDEKPLKRLPFPPSPPTYLVDPLIFQFGRKHKDANEDVFNRHQRLFCSKRMRLEDSHEMSSLLEGSTSSIEESQNEFKRFDRMSQVKRSRTTINRRSPLNSLYQNTNHSSTTAFSNFVNQLMINALRDQLLASHSSWIPPKDEPLDLSCKETKLGLPNNNIFCSIRKLVEPQFCSYSEVRRHNTFPLRKPFEAPHLLPHNVEVLMNSAPLFNDLKSNFLWRYESKRCESE